MKKIVYYQNEDEEFSKAKIEPILIDQNYKYKHGVVWNFVSFLCQNILSMPIKKLYAFFKFRVKYVGKEKLREYKKTGYFIYANHTQEFADTFIPSLACYPKRNFFIVNPENVSMKGLKTLVRLLGAIPVPNTFKAAKNFNEIIKEHIQDNHVITIYPEAHIWPFYTKIRKFSDTSLKYPIDLDVPVFTITNTYHKRKKNKVKIISYIDGPILPDKNLSLKEQRKDLCQKVYQTMQKRSKENTYLYVKYMKM